MESLGLNGWVPVVFAVVAVPYVSWTVASIYALRQEVALLKAFLTEARDMLKEIQGG